MHDRLLIVKLGATNITLLAVFFNKEKLKYNQISIEVRIS